MFAYLTSFMSFSSFAQPAGTIGELKDDPHLVIFPGGKNSSVGLRDAPLDRSMQNSFSLALLGVQRLHRVGEIMTEHARGMGGVGKPIVPQMTLQTVIPAVRHAGRAPPIALGDVHHMVLIIPKPGVGIL